MVKKSPSRTNQSIEQHELAIIHVLNGLFQRVSSTYAHSIGQDVIRLRLGLEHLNTLLADSTAGNTEASELVKSMRSSIDSFQLKTRTFFDQLPDFLVYGRVNLHETINQQLQSIKRSCDQRVCVEAMYNSTKQEVFGSPLIGEHIYNILDNSRQAVTQSLTNAKISKGSIRLLASDHNHPTSGVKGTHVEIIIQDNGGGVPNDLLPHIGRFGFTTKKQGSGFALAAAKSFFRSIGGSLLFANTEEGFAVTLRVPVFDNELHKDQVIPFDLSRA